MNNEIQMKHRKCAPTRVAGRVKIRDITLLFHRDTALYV